jgi:hypothetical protein
MYHVDTHSISATLNRETIQILAAKKESNQNGENHFQKGTGEVYAGTGYRHVQVLWVIKRGYDLMPEEMWNDLDTSARLSGKVKLDTKMGKNKRQK